jgi:hypothetical protein
MIPRNSNFMQFVTECSYGQLHNVWMYETVQLTSKLQPTGAWQTAAWPPRRMCYRPPVFFRHLHLVTLSLPQGKKICAFQKCYPTFFYLCRIACLKLRNLKLHSGCVCNHSGCVYNHSGCVCNHSGCVCNHSGCVCNHLGVSITIRGVSVTIRGVSVTIRGVSVTIRVVSNHSGCVCNHSGCVCNHSGCVCNHSGCV